MKWIYTLVYLTLILLTWRMWSAPNNASKCQMGFNSAFKGLIHNVFTVGCTRWNGVEAQNESFPKWRFMHQAAMKSLQIETKNTDDGTDQICYWHVGALSCYFDERH